MVNKCGTNDAENRNRNIDGGEEEDVVSPNSSVQSRPSINSATYTRPKPAVSGGGAAILPVGYPIFGTRGETSSGGFQNPWEALHHHQQQWGGVGGDGGYFTQEDRHFFQEEEENDDDVDHYLRSLHHHHQQQQHNRPPPLHGLCLDLEEDPPPYYDDLVDKQSPASGLPPQSPPPPQQLKKPAGGNFFGPSLGEEQLKKQSPDAAAPLLITPEHIRRPRGEYIPLNPDIDKAHPPRWPAAGANGWVADPFNVSDEEAPPVPAERLSPGHIFASVGDIHAAIGRRGGSGGGGDDKSVESPRGGTVPSSSGVSDGDQTDEVCSDGEEEVEGVTDDELPDPETVLHEEEEDDDEEDASMTTPVTKTSPTTPATIVSSPYGTYSKVMKKGSVTSPIADKIKSSPVATTAVADLDAVAIGALDYEQLMNYFEGLKESAA